MRQLIACLVTVLCVFLPAQAESPAADAIAADIRFYYEDVQRAARFYRENLGLNPIETRDEEVVLEIAPGAFLTLATLESGGATPRIHRAPLRSP